jgi:ubiquinone/menaquinone biosynthesis C-methylase UbiE
MANDAAAWKQMAEWYDAKIGDSGDLWHRALIDPTLLRVLGPVAGQDVLDLACGNGYLSRRFAREGGHVTGVDASAPIIALAQGREDAAPLGITYYVADATRLHMLADATFDIVISNMAIMDIADAEGVFGEAARVLRPGGRLVFSMTHPCFEVVGYSGWQVEKVGPNRTVWRKIRRYREPFEHTFYWRLDPDHPDDLTYTPAYHRPLSWYVRALRAAGFVITALEEPEPTAEFLAHDDEGALIAEIPLHCVIEAISRQRSAIRSDEGRISRTPDR